MDNSTEFMNAKSYLDSFSGTDRTLLGKYFVNKLTSFFRGNNRNLMMHKRFHPMSLDRNLVKDQD